MLFMAVTPVVRSYQLPGVQSRDVLGDAGIIYIDSLNSFAVACENCSLPALL